MPDHPPVAHFKSMGLKHIGDGVYRSVGGIRWVQVHGGWERVEADVGKA